MAYRMRRGFGQQSQTGLPSYSLIGTVDCSNPIVWPWFYKCWQYTPDAWRQMRAFAEQGPGAPVPPPAVSAGESTIPAPYTQAEYQAAVDEALAQGQTETQAKQSAWAASFVPVSASPSTLGGSWWVWIAVAGVAVFALVAVGGGSPRRYGR